MYTEKNYTSASSCPLRRTLHPSSFILLNITLHTHTQYSLADAYYNHSYVYMLPKSHLLQQQAPFCLQFHVRPPSHPPSLPSPSFFLTHLSFYVKLFYLILLVSHLPYFPILILYPYIPRLISFIFQSQNCTLRFCATFALFSYPYLVSLYSLYHLYINNNFLTISSISYIFLYPYLVSLSCILIFGEGYMIYLTLRTYIFHYHCNHM